MADDYSALRPVQSRGLVGAQIAWYRGWTGRFSYTLLYSLLGLIGPATPRFMPGLLLTLWFGATVWAIYEIHSLSGKFSWTRVVIFAGFLIFATLETAPNVCQSLFWQTGALTHFVPFIPISLFVGLISRSMNERNNHLSYRLNLLCAGILTFFAGGFSDAYVVLQSFGLMLSIVATQIFGSVNFKSRIRPVLVAGLVGSLIALIIVAAAPGNSVRQAFFPKQFGHWDILRLTVFYAVRFVAKLVLTHPSTFTVSLTLPLVLVLRNLSDGDQPTWHRQSCIRLLLLVPVAMLLLILCCTGTGVYALSTMLPERARILLSLIFVCGTGVLSHAAGQYLSGRLRRRSCKTRLMVGVTATVALMLLTLSPLISFVSILRLREKARSFAADWDRQDSELKAAKQSGVTDVTVQQIGDFQWRIGKGAGDLHLRPDPTFWINQTTAKYYGLTSVRAKEDLTISR